jgi:hypothetical protein
MDGQAVDLELVDLEVSDHRSPDRKPANDQDADGRCAEATCSKPLVSQLPAGLSLASWSVAVRPALVVRWRKSASSWSSSSP